MEHTHTHTQNCIYSCKSVRKLRDCDFIWCYRYMHISFKCASFSYTNFLYDSFSLVAVVFFENQIIWFISCNLHFALFFFPFFLFFACSLFIIMLNFSIRCSCQSNLKIFRYTKQWWADIGIGITINVINKYSPILGLLFSLYLVFLLA